jgi:hypothetical protein
VCCQPDIWCSVPPPAWTAPASASLLYHPTTMALDHVRWKGEDHERARLPG